MSRRRTRYGRLREQGNYFTRKDAKAWSRLIREARICAANLDDPGGDFAQAADAAAPCCFPWPVIKGREVSTAFRELIHHGRQWPDLEPEFRQSASPEVTAAANEAERIMGPAPPKPEAAEPRSRFRADLDG